MADPLKIIRRLDVVTTDYAVFERDQVLTHEQLNSVGEYLDDQGRLSRTQLLGVGIVGGLRPVVGKGEIVVGKGVGVTTDGDLLGLAVDRVFSQFLPYDESAPAYEPFYIDGKIIPLLELLPSDAADKRQGKPLAEIGDRLKEMVLLVFMESYENDPDLCTGGDCDNRGRRAHNTQRFLLVGRDAAEKLAEKLGGQLLTGAALAARLPRLVAARAQLGNTLKDTLSVTSAETFVARYRSACTTTLNDLQKAINVLQLAFDRAWPEELPAPSAWLANLERIDKAVGQGRLGIQYYHAFLKDLVATWGELRETLFADHGVLCPDPGAFAKHLLLGALADPTQLRTGSYPSPWLANSGAIRQRLLFLLGKLATMISSFSLPTTTSPLPKVTPSRAPTAPLEQRAVPCYYVGNEALRRQWNEARLVRAETADNFGYQWTPVPGGAGDDPFERDLDTYDFFRIEGHLGMKVDAAEAAIETLIRQRNLPIAVISVLLHNRRDLVLRGPKFKLTSLHSMHYLLRQDLASQIKDNVAFGSRLINDVKTIVPLLPKVSTAPLNADPVKAVETAHQALSTLQVDLVGSETAPGPLAARSYKAYSAKPVGWAARLDETVVTTSKAKAGLGELLRTDVMSPVDTLGSSKSHLWVNWLGDILKKREDDQKDRLLFANMLKEHPGLEHCGGAAPGGTFVLTYDDSGVVIGDLALPYWIDDVDESEREDPPLVLPDIHVRLPADLLPSKVIRPMDMILDDFRLTKVLPEIKVQENYMRFFQDSLGGLGDVLRNTSGPALGGTRFDSGDDLLNQLLAEIDGKKNQVDGLREMVADDRLPVKTREAVEAQIKRVEVELGNLVKNTTEHFAVTAPETVRTGTAAVKVYATINQGINAVGNKTVTTQLRSDLAGQAGGMTGSSAQVITHIMNTGFGGF
jgi:hypothetical protein